MTPEERFETIETILYKLADAQQRSQERHQALAETVQMLTAGVQQDATSIAALARNAQILQDSIKALETVAAARR